MTSFIVQPLHLDFNEIKRKQKSKLHVEPSRKQNVVSGKAP